MNKETFLEQGIRQIRCHFFLVMIQAFKAEETKPTKGAAHTAKTQSNQGIRPVWSESSLGICFVSLGPKVLQTDGEASDYADQNLRWAHMSFRWFYGVMALFIRLVCYGICFSQTSWPYA